MARINGTENGDTLFGGGGSDNIYGLGGNDVLYGGGGSDNLFGAAGDDKLFGEDGDDLLAGAAGADQLYGGAGRDTFHYYRQSDSAAATGFDTIHDFQSGIDKTNLEPVDANAATTQTQGKTNTRYWNEAFVYQPGGTDGVTPGHLTLTHDPTTNVTTLNGYTDTVAGADFTIYIVGQVDPLTDIIF